MFCLPPTISSHTVTATGTHTISHRSSRYCNRSVCYIGIYIITIISIGRFDARDIYRAKGASNPNHYTDLGINIRLGPLLLSVGVYAFSNISSGLYGKFMQIEWRFNLTPDSSQTAVSVSYSPPSTSYLK